MPIYRFGDMLVDPLKYPWGYHKQQRWALYFDGNSYGRVDIGTGIYENFTISAWLKADNWGSGTRKEFATVPDDVNGTQIDFGVDSNNKLTHWRGSAAGQVGSGYDVSGLSGFHHVAYTQKRESASNVTVKIYLDAVEVDSMSGDWENVDFSKNWMAFGADQQRLRYWIGALYQLGFWSVAVEPSEIYKIMGNPATAFRGAQVVLLMLDNVSLEDVSGNKNHGTIHGATWIEI